MKKNIYLLFFFISVFQSSKSQEINLFAKYPESLKENANAIVKENSIEIEITSFDRINIKKSRTITVYNEIGLNYLDAYEYYDKATTVKNIEARIYNAFGSEIKKIKRKDFKENSVSQGAVITDNRILYLDYTPIQYPFTIVYESEISSSNTAFIPSWSPVEDYYLSILSSKFSIKYSDEVKLKYKEYNFNSKIVKKDKKNHLEFSVNNVLALKKEQMAPSLIKLVPFVMFGLEEFEIEGVKGNAKDWDSFGKWMYSNLLSDTEEIPEETRAKIQELLGQEKDPIEIAKIIYKFVQDKTRYVSIQLGIGGWRPMLAKDVDRLGYGDCKALTNYTRSLLKIFNVPSYYAVVYGDRNKRNIQQDFVSMQGNHVILGIPNNDEIIWLECTSQTQPFGFQGDFTDDRDVLVIDSESSKIIKTKTYLDANNIKIQNGSYTISEEGSLMGKLKSTSKGLQYDWEQVKERLSKEDQIKGYYQEFSNINNLRLVDIKISNNKKDIEFIQELELKATGYAQNLNGKMIFALNAFSQNSFVPKKYKNREFPFEIQRGYVDEDTIEITIPEGYIIEAKPNNIVLNTEFGIYEILIENTDINKLIYKRKLIINTGYYENLKFEQYRKFRETIAKNDNSKIVISKS